MADSKAEMPELRPSTLTLLLPWLAAPLFCLLPIGGCAIATSMRHAADRVARTVTADPPVVAISLPR